MQPFLQVYSIFQSIDGECNDYGQGALTTFIRFSGCNLRCQYGPEGCDTPNSLSGTAGSRQTIDQVISQVEMSPIRKVSITGGEPLLQIDGLVELVRRLKAREFVISIETNGSLLRETERLLKLPTLVDCLVVDYKLPSSGEEKQMKMGIFYELRPQDYCKFVILDKQDFERACAVINLFRKYRMKLAFSPVWGKLDPNLLIKWMMEAGLSMGILSLQLHKIIQLSEPQ